MTRLSQNETRLGSAFALITRKNVRKNVRRAYASKTMDLIDAKMWASHVMLALALVVDFKIIHWKKSDGQFLLKLESIL